MFHKPANKFRIASIGIFLSAKLDSRKFRKTIERDKTPNNLASTECRARKSEIPRRKRAGREGDVVCSTC